MLLRLLVPDEWLSAYSARQEMHAVASRTKRGWFRHALGIIVPLLLGGAAALPVKELVSDGVVEAVLTIDGILAGFVITLMLFTGRQPGMEELSLEDLRAAIDKTFYLLWSQANTLCAYILTAIIAIAWLMIAESDTLKVSAGPAITCALGGFVLLALVRTILLPYQVYELHRFNLLALMRSKEEAVRQAKRAERDRLTASNK